MKADPHRVILPEPDPGYLIRSAFWGFISRLQLFVYTQTASSWRRTIDLNQRNLRITGFFNYWRGRAGSEFITDATHPAYREFLNKCLDDIVPKNLRKNLRVLDIGSGTLTFHMWLLSHKIRPQAYLGIDLTQKGNRKYASQHGEITLKAVNLEESLNQHIAHHDIAIAINLLPYLKNLEPFFEIVVQSHASRLVIVDPVPSWHWLKFYSLITIHFRKKSLIVKLAKEHGWQLETERTLYFKGKRGTIVWPISRLFVFEKA